MKCHVSKAARRQVLSLLLCLLPSALAVGIILLSRIDAAATERIYSRTIFPVLSGIIGFAARLVPFSLVGVVLWCAGPIVLVWLFVTMRRFCKSQNRRAVLLRTAKTVLLVPSLLFFLFGVTCAPNYERLTFAEQSGLPVRDSTAEELASLCEELIARTSAAREDCEEQDGVFSAGEFSFLSEASLEAFLSLREDYPFLQQVSVAPKAMPGSVVLSYLETTGFYSCFTAEPNINTHMPDLELPFTMCHELAHTSGFLREDEANFIGYLAAVGSNVPALRYSGLICALNYSMNQLCTADSKAYRSLRETYSDKMQQDLAVLNAYWQPYLQSKTAKAYSTVNDAFLKLNRQEDGRKSYGRMVDLLLAEYRQNHGEA